nr:MAG TPA_asm: hypothetical protein [Caudoviricetes sp.]
MLFFFCPCQWCSSAHLDGNEDYIPRLQVTFDIADLARIKDNLVNVSAVAFAIHDTAYQVPQGVTLNGNSFYYVFIYRAAAIIRRPNAAGCQQNEQYFFHHRFPPLHNSLTDLLQPSKVAIGSISIADADLRRLNHRCIFSHMLVAKLLQHFISTLHVDAPAADFYGRQLALPAHIVDGSYAGRYVLSVILNRHVQYLSHITSLPSFQSP